jgi:transcriptional regulator with XRE-family HTH domain
MAMDFGAFLRSRRQLAKLSMQEISERAKIEASVLGRMESGMQGPPGPDALLALVTALSLNPADTQTLLDLAHAAITSGRFDATGASRSSESGGLQARLRDIQVAEPTAAALEPPLRPGPQTLVRDLRAVLLAGLADEAPADEPLPASEPTAAEAPAGSPPAEEPRPKRRLWPFR